VNTEFLLQSLGLPLGTFVICFLSGIIPLIHAELFLLTVSALADAPPLLLLAVVSSLGQMLAKVVMYLGGRGILKLPAGRLQHRLARFRVQTERWQHRPDLFIWFSSFTGFPPFLIISVLAGTLEFPLARFCLAGWLGRLMRFALVLSFPQWLKGWLY
jgi:membrane protein YqaA with SNARE-associated domain